MKTIITIIRAAIGWHFLYEGYVKLFSDSWSAASYLNNTHGFFSDFYHWLAASPVRLGIVDFLNIWGLILIGLALFIGLCTRWAALFGALLLALYYFAYPPFGYSLYSGDGSVYIINLLFIEAAILIFFFCYKEKGYGLDRVIKLFRRKKQTPIELATTPADNIGKNNITRREVLKDLVALPVLGLIGYGANRSHKYYGIDTLSGATIQINRVALGELKGELPKGKIGPHEITRLVMGDNLIGGWSHARDLMYVGSLMRAYNTEKKIFDTLMLAEQAGINTTNMGYLNMDTMVKYRKVTGSKIKIISQVGIRDKEDEDIYEDVNVCIGNGIDIIQLQGNWCDWLVRDGKFDVIQGLMERVHSQGLIFGMGAHTIDSLLLCEEKGIIPDYYMKTMHHDNYWSAHPRENRRPFEVDGKRYKNHDMFHDNCFDSFPDRTVEFINRINIPVMGFKVLAAGAIHPKDGFKYAFENGADFVCAGMFDFQIVDDVNICLDTLASLENRSRAWYA